MASAHHPSSPERTALPAASSARPATPELTGMGRRIQEHDWSLTPLGPVQGWPPHLRATVELMAVHGFPMIVLWGPDLLQIYNDGYAEIMADKHPGGLGQPTAECWPEVWHINGPLYEQVWQGRTLTFSDKCYPLRRRGVLQDVWFTITYSPLRNEDGAVEGVLVTMFDTTAEHVALAECEQSARELRATNAALQANEERFRQFAAASSDALWIRDAHSLETELISAAFDTVYGVPASVAAGEMKHWAARVVPDDREDAIRQLVSVRDGAPCVQEFRVQREDDSRFRWIRDTMFPLCDADGRVTRIAGIARDVTDERHWAEHQAILVAELQHRVRNIMASIGSIALRTRESSTSVEDYAQRLSGRVMSLARTQALLTRAGNVGIELHALVGDELGSAAYGDGRIHMEGPAIVVPPKAAEVLSLAIHELGSNAQRHGALSTPEGRVHVSWTVQQRDGQRWVEVRWQERHAPRLDQSGTPRRGFGATLIEDRIPYELEGEGRLTIRADGTDACIRFPLRHRDSILQTDAPPRSGVDGGSVDIGDMALLQDCRVLVVEDDFYLAHDTAAALRSAGARVDGPYASVQTALQRLQAGHVDAAVIDINLGQGPEQRLITALQAAGLPFVVVTGYHAGTGAPLGAAFPRLEKPVAPTEIVRALVRVRRPPELP